MDKYVGRLLDNRYEILEIIGTGGMAVVYKARCHRLNRFVAIKILRDEYSKDSDFRRRFQAESQAVAMLSHANIDNVYDVSRGGELDYIVMELIDGITLKQYMQQKGQLNWRESLHFAMQIAKALEHAHSRGVIHRDIKPHNIMVLKDGSVKVADFGIAHFSSAQDTLTREALGSVHYISPEQARGAKVDNRSDIYSLGVVMYEMLTGRPPYDGESAVSVAIQHINSTPVPIRERNAEVPEGLAQITSHAMSSNLIGRYSNATELLEDLEEFRKNPQVRFRFGAAPGEKAAQLAAQKQAQAAQAAKPAVTAATQAEPIPEESASRAPLIAGIIFLVVVFVGLGIFCSRYVFHVTGTASETVTVPDFTGEYYSAIDPNDYPDFVLIQGDSQYDDEVAAGYVLSQTPKAGKSVKSGTEITLIVSLGEQTASMPYLINRSLSEAQKLLEELGLSLQISVTYAQSSSYVAGQVIETSPSYDTTLTKGATVTLVVAESYSEDDVLVEVPSFVGLTEEDAMLTAASVGLTVSIQEVESDTLPEGYVTFQSIDANEMVREGTTINLHISTGLIDEEEEAEPEDGDAEEAEEEAEADAELPAEEPIDDAISEAETAEESDSEETEAVVAASTAYVTIHLPPDTENVGVAEVYLTLNGQQYGEVSTQELSAEASSFVAILQGTGTMTLDVYVDGVLYETQTVIFD